MSSLIPQTSSPQTPDPETDLRRLMLYEVLLEEYESHTRPRPKTDEPTPASSARPMPGDIRDQPLLPKQTVKEIRDEGKAEAAKNKEHANEYKRDEVEYEFNGRLVSKVLNLIVDAQKQASEDEFSKLKARDVMNYKQSSKDFPQEVIVDQWFSESQFESYRALGSHIIDAICGGDQNKINLAAFARKVNEHNRVNFRVFKDQISLAALEAQFKRAMQNETPKVYQDKVKEYLKDLLDIKVEKY